MAEQRREIVNISHRKHSKMSQKFRLIWTIVLLTEVFLYSVTSLSVQPNPELGNIIFSQKQKVETSVTKEQVVYLLCDCGWQKQATSRQVAHSFE